MNTYEIVTERIINLLEQGVVPWRRPWSAAGTPRNLVSKKIYRGVNVRRGSRLSDCPRKGGESERTRCSITGSLPAHAALATARYEAVGIK
jgi:hypothetical protein